MKIIRHVSSGPKENEFFHFIKNNLPSSLIAKEKTDGYATILVIFRRPNQSGNFLDTVKWKLFENPVAEAWCNEVYLFHPEFYSDFEDLLRKYEAKFQEETKFEYWES